nr:copia protein [Tanacetum cinerariifolium]
FIDADHPSHVYKLKKAPYGLKQAPKAWYDELSTFLLQNHFFKGTIDPTLFIRRFHDDILVTEIELELEQSQQGSSHEVSVSTEGVEELKRIDQAMALQPHSNGVKIQDLMLNYQRYIQDESSSFQDLEHEGGNTRSQGGIILKDKGLEISVVRDQDP